MGGDQQRERVFVIAEAGSNWRRGERSVDLAAARQLIETAAEAGADAVKFQLFRAESTWSPGAGPCDHLAKKGLPQSIEEIFRDLELPTEFLPQLAAWCQELEIEFMVTPFSESAFHQIDPFVQRHKIASFELHHPTLLRLAAASGKQVLLSTGLSTLEQIGWAVEQIGEAPLTLLQCTIQYPTDSGQMHLQTLRTLRERFQTPVGLSDHSFDPVMAPTMAVALGATVIEKHFTLDRALPGPDHSWALDPPALGQMVGAIREAERMLGDSVKGIADSERELLDYAPRRLQAVREIALGEKFEMGENVDILRPGEQEVGLHPRHLAELLGRRAARTISAGAGIREGDWE